MRSPRTLILAIAALIALAGAGNALAGSACTTVCYVNGSTGSDANGGASPGDAFKTIQHGLDVVSPGGTVIVAKGTYIENLAISQPVTLQGAGQEKTVVIPAVSNPNPCPGSSLCGSANAASNVILVQASDVTITGLTVDGHNPALHSGISARGVDLDARNGIIENYYAGVYNNLVVHHVTVQNIYLRGIYASSGGTFNFHDDMVTNVQADPSSIAMFNFGGSGVFSSNRVSYANDAISSNWSMGTKYVDNVITNSASGIHTDNNDGSGGVGDSIQHNTVLACTTGGYGAWVFAPYVDVTVSDNLINGCNIGLAAFGSQAPSTVHFSRNDVTGDHSKDSRGAWITTDLLGYCVNNVSATFDHNVIRNTVNGIWVEQPAVSSIPSAGCPTATPTATLSVTSTSLLHNRTGLNAVGGTSTLSGSCIASNQTGILNAFGATTSIVRSDIVDNSPYAVKNLDTAPLMATTNFWGEDGPNTTSHGQNRISGPVTVNPYLKHETGACELERVAGAGARGSSGDGHDGGDASTGALLPRLD